MRTCFYAVLVLNFVLLAVGYGVMPDRVAMHFGSGGGPNGWGSKAAYTVIMALCVLVCAAIGFSGRLTSVFPDSMLSIPNKEYWLREENRPLMRRKLDGMMMEFGVAILLFFALVQVLCAVAQFQDPVRLNEPAMLTGLGLLLAYSLYFCFRSIRIFRVPE